MSVMTNHANAMFNVKTIRYCHIRNPLPVDQVVHSIHLVASNLTNTCGCCVFLLSMLRVLGDVLTAVTGASIIGDR